LETETGTVASWIDQGVGWVAIDRPRARNAADAVTMEALCGVLDRLIGDDAVKAIVMTGTGKHFLAGGDFDFLRDMAATGGSGAHATVYRWFQGATRRLFQCSKPTIAAVSGAAITVGCEIALACDVRLADSTAFFQESWIDLGLIAPLGGSLLLPRIVGFGLAKEMILESRRIHAEEALRVGLVNAVYETQQALRDAAQARALAMAARPAAAFRTAKELLHRGLESTMADAWSAGVDAQALLLASNGFRDAVEALAPR